MSKTVTGAPTPEDITIERWKHDNPAWMVIVVHPPERGSDRRDRGQGRVPGDGRGAGCHRIYGEDGLGDDRLPDQ